MSDTDPDVEGPRRREERRAVVGMLATPPILLLLLFLPAGTLAWTRGWLFVALFVVSCLVAVLILRRANPEIFAARSRVQPGTKLWDRRLLSALIPILCAVLPVAALDDARFHWLPMPWWVCGLGYALFLAGMAISIWAEAVNRFFEPGVRIQTERGHKVIDTGPYAIVRHPGYVGGSMVIVGTALSLGSVWALIPAATFVVGLLVRTRWEEQTLRAELPGYEDYTRRVRYRWIPRIY